MAKAHGQMPSEKNAPTASAPPRYEPVGRWAVAPNDATKAVGGKDKKKAGLASPLEARGPLTAAKQKETHKEGNNGSIVAIAEKPFRRSC